MRKPILLCIGLLFVLFSAAGMLFACADQEGDAAGSDDRLQIVATIFPEYDWVKEVLGENPADAQLTLLLNSGVDLHSFQPTAADILKISTCDLFIYVGGESDEWVADALSEAVNEDMVVINLLDVLGDQVREEEVVPGMQAEEEEEEEDEPEYDEHVWLSLGNAAALTEAIADALQTIDPDHAALYRDNAAAYTSSLAALDGRYRQAVQAAKEDTLVFGDRFPFRYLTDDYDLDYYAAFTGCSAETEASFETIVFLADKVDELGLHAIMTIEGANHDIAQTVRDNTKTKDQEILTLDSMQSTTGQDVSAGTTYLSIMEQNLVVLQQALQ